MFILGINPVRKFGIWPIWADLTRYFENNKVISILSNDRQSNIWIIAWPELGKHIFKARPDDVIKRKHFRRNWPFVRGIHRFPVNSPHKGQWRGALMFSLICVWINDWVNNREAGDMRRHHAHYDVTVMEAIGDKVTKLHWQLFQCSEGVFATSATELSWGILFLPMNLPACSSIVIGWFILNLQTMVSLVVTEISIQNNSSIQIYE